MKLYHFISEEYGLQAIRDKRLKAATLDALNDPFELYSLDISSEMLRQAMPAYKDGLTSTTFLVCLSKTIKSPVLWGHYADKHTGLALEFEVHPDLIKHINYQDSKFKVDSSDLKDCKNTIEKLLTTKYSDWSYEEERRIILSIDDVVFGQNDMYFYDFNEKFKLKALLLGALSQLDKKTISMNLSYGEELRVSKCQTSLSEFKIIIDDQDESQVIFGNNKC
jgi:hypothetical protein